MRDVKNILKKEGVRKAEVVVESSPHHRLWRLLAHDAMRGLDFAAAEPALVQCQDYQGIRFCKKLSKLENEGITRAGVHAYFGELDEAEKLYLQLDRKDLAIDLRRTMCQYEHVLHRLCQAWREPTHRNTWGTLFAAALCLPVPACRVPFKPDITPAPDFRWLCLHK